VADHGGVGVDQLGVDPEVVVVDHHRHPVPDVAALALHRGPDVVDVLGGAHAHPLEVEEQGVAAGVEGDPPLEVEVEQRAVEAHERAREDAAVHDVGRAHDRAEAHVGQDVALDVDAGRHLGELDPLVAAAEHARSVT
jgi:hypothetical protein